MNLSRITDPNEMFQQFLTHFATLAPAFELQEKAELAAEINRLKAERNAVILGHNYMEPLLFHSIPDYVGDSLELSRKAAAAEQDVIVFCGVKFMAETAKILSPDKTVLLPSKAGGCSLAAAITAEDVRALRRTFPNAPVVTYVNTYADVKAECDICCTSGNASAVAESLNAETIIFLPDEYLATNVARECGRTIIFPDRDPESVEKTAGESRFIGWSGRCEVHELFSVEDIENIRRQYPDVVVLAHPECSPAVVDAADFSGSTSAMDRYVRETDAPRYLLMTECSMADNIAAANPDKELVRACSIGCPHMHEITLRETRDALLNLQYVVDVPEDIRRRARTAVERMIAISGSGKMTGSGG